jgi:pimeloyl-ACP methyl ester carboxylesterase
MRHLRWTSTLLLLSLLGECNTAVAETPAAPAFVPADCDLPDIAAIAPRLRCGTVRVPRDHARPDAGSFSLAVVVIASEQQPSLPDPVVYISGGPGYPLTVYATHQAQPPYAPRRNLILIDQRGTGRSEPSLCPDLNRRLMETTLAIAAGADDAIARHAAYMDCRDEAIRRGFELKDFGTSVTVEDFAWVRRALGVERWNVYGQSYGTAVAMGLAARHPDALRLVILDSIYPPDPVPLWSTIVGDARDAFFAHCARDAACSTSFPDLGATYLETLTRLKQNPLVVTMPPQLQQPYDQVRITAFLFESLVSRLLYFPNFYPALPRIIQSIHDGDARGLGPILAAQLAVLATQSYATHAAVECRDRRHFRGALPDDASVLDRAQLYGVCEHWSEPGPAPLVPVGSRVPMLVWRANSTRWHGRL